jgi:hypothetical protein
MKKFSNIFYYIKQSNGKLNACFRGVLPLFYVVYLPKISRRFKLLYTCLLTFSPTIFITRFLLFDFSISSNREPKMTSTALLFIDDSIAIYLYILLALLLALFSSSNSFVHSYPLVLLSTLHCPQLLLSNLCSTLLLFVLSCQYHCLRRCSILCAALKYTLSIG